MTETEPPLTPVERLTIAAVYARLTSKVLSIMALRELHDTDSHVARSQKQDQNPCRILTGFATSETLAA
ncbi:hypothetical protein E3G52_001444 [Mycobacteroides abscessus]|nr:hypothetical protein [Mycobacteroides abscessus]